MARSVPSKFNGNLHGQKIYFRKRSYPNAQVCVYGPYLRRPSIRKCTYFKPDNESYWIEEVEEYVMVIPGATIEF